MLCQEIGTLCVDCKGKEKVLEELLRLLPLLCGVLLAVVGGVELRQGANSVGGPGESIQKAVNAAHPGGTIVVRGRHRGGCGDP